MQNELDRNLLQRVLDASDVKSVNEESFQERARAIEELCNRGANPCAFNKFSTMSVESSALIMASAMDLRELVRLMLKSPQALANPSAVDQEGDTALHAAVLGGSLGCFNLLCGLSDVNIRNRRGKTPLMLALSDQEWEMFEALAPLSDLTVVDEGGMTAREQAEEFSRWGTLPSWGRMVEILRAAEERQNIELAVGQPKISGRAKSKSL